MSIWGKIIGGTAGFALGGPIGAILGVMVGGSFDRTKKRFKNRKGSFHASNILIMLEKIFIHLL